MLSEERSLLTGLAFTAIALVAGFLTWLCVGWFGNQPPLTAMVAVVLVEVFLASFGMIALLLTERMTVSLLKWEKRQPPAPRVRRKSEPIWFRLPDPVTEPTVARGPAPRRQTIPFPAPDERPSPADNTPHRRAA